jgi:acetyl esterase
LNPLAMPACAKTLARLPQALVITAEVDVLRDDAEAYAARLADEGVEVEAMRFNGVFHSFFTEPGTFREADEAISLVALRLRDCFAR